MPSCLRPSATWGLTQCAAVEEDQAAEAVAELAVVEVANAVVDES
jgi:hypothetical protein